MEALKNDRVHTPDSTRSLSCINTHHIEELSKEIEEELLYGAGDDGDEEDALSDDSIRLRLSDDEAEPEDDLTYVPKDRQISKQVASGAGDGVEACPVPEKNITTNDTSGRNKSQEEHCSGNVSMNDKVIIPREKDVTSHEQRSMSPQVPNMPYSPWPNYDPQWRFTNNVHSRSFRSGNHLSYARYRHMTPPKGYYRLQSYNFSKRFHNAFPPFERGRGYGMFYPYSRPMCGNRQHRKSFKPITTKKHNTPNELDQNLVSSSNTNIVPRTEANNSVKNVSPNANKQIESNAIGSEHSISNNMNNSILCELLKKNLNVNKNDHLNKGSLDLPQEIQVEEGNVKVVTSSNDHESKDITNDANNFNGSSSENMTNASINSYDSSKETDKKDESCTHNGDVNSNDFYVSDNSKKMETLLSEDTNRISDSNETTECIEQINASNEKQDELIKTPTYLDVNKSKLKTDVNQRIELGENNGKLVSDNEITANGEVINHEESSGNEKDVPVQNLKINEDNEDNVLKANASTLNDLSNSEGDNNIKKIQNNVLCEPITNSERCDKELNVSDNSTKSTKIALEVQLINSNIESQEQNKDAVQENVKSAEKDRSMTNSAKDVSKLTESIQCASDANNSSSVNTEKSSVGLVNDAKDNNGDGDKKVTEAPVPTQRRKRRTKKMMLAAQEAAAEEEKQVRESGRQKRRTAKNAEEIIRKKFLNLDSDLESSDGSDKFVIVNHKMNQDVRALSPPSLKRNFPDNDGVSVNGILKKIKVNSNTLSEATKENNFQNIKKLNYVHKFFQRDLKEKLPKLKQEELEELLIQKIVETITMRGEIGKLREQARISERNQEVTRQKCQQLAKQIKDFEMVLCRNAADRRANNDKPTPPIKINRSVGLQVNFVTDQGMQNLRQLQQTSTMKSLNISNGNNTLLNTPNTETNNATSPRKGIKVRSPRRIEPAIGQATVVSQNHTQPTNVMPSITPAALVVTKPVDTQHTLTLPNQSNVQQILTNQQTQPQQSPQPIVLNGKFPNQMNRQGTMNVTKSNANDLIDLTDEEEKSKVTAPSVPVVTTTISDQQINLSQKTQQPCFQRVIQTIPGGVAITSQPPSIRVVQPASQPTPTALVNNMSAPRLTYVMQSAVGPARQLLITPNSSPMRPVTSCTRASFSTVTYKTGISTVANGTVRVLTTPATPNVQLNKHPAPLPDSRNYGANPHWKLPPPAPSLKISKVSNGIVLSWNMSLSEKYADIASYQLYAYQEVAGVPPNTALWKKVGDVRALPLPMACTLTQFSEGNNYYFAIRAVDTHSRKGQYSTPGNISL